MPKRFIEDSIYLSDKLLSVPEEFRGEYSWIIPMAEANGTMEYSNGLVWRTAYALMRPSWTPVKVGEMLKAFEEAKLLFPFEWEGKRYVYFVGIEKGRLPKSSERSRFRNSNSIVPAQELADFLGQPLNKVMAQYRDVIASPSPTPREEVALSNGAGAVSGDGAGVSEGAGESIGVRTSEAANAATRGCTELSSQYSHSKGNKTGTGNSNAEALADHLFRLVQENPKYNPNKTPTNWRFLWAKDIAPLLSTYSYDALTRLIEFSQCDSQSPFNVRAEGFVKNVPLLASKFKVPSLAEEAKGKKVPGAYKLKPQVPMCDLCCMPEAECECEFASEVENDD